MKVTTLFISIYISLFCPLCALEGKHICSYTRSGKKYFDCCLGYKEMNGVCVQKVCYPGYVGKYCNTTCPENNFGQGCSFKCKCEQTQYCHHACGCLLRSVKSGNMSKDGKNSTKISRDDIVPDNCMGELKTATNITRETGTTDSTELFLLVSTSCSLLVFLLSIASLIYCHQKLTTLKVTETKTQQNNLYSVEEVNTDEDIENEPDETPEDPIYNSYEEPCYSILKLKVNRSSLCVMEQP